MICRDTSIQNALRARAAPLSRQRGFLLNPYRFAAGGGGSGDPHWASVSALLHMNGTVGGNTFVDETGKTWTTTGNAVITNTNAVFGQTAVFDGAGGAITSPSSSGFSFGTGDFTIEAFGNFSSSSANRALFSFGTNNTVYLASVGTMYFFNGSSNLVDAGTPALGVSEHYALVRSSGVVTLYRSGISYNTAVYTTNITSTNMVIGNNSLGSGAMHGYVDEFRVTIGVARYTANFTPPSSPFPNSA